jgi:pyruvate dehydrogenase E1 component
MIDKEQKDWLDSVEWLVAEDPKKGYEILRNAYQHYYLIGGEGAFINTYYTNSMLTISEELPKESARVNELIRWNAMSMVVRGTKVASELGGHLASYASSAILYDVAFEHFFQAGSGQYQDCIFFQGHSAPGFYARAFLEGRLSESLLNHFRQEAAQPGLSSYPHPRLMPDFWSFPTVSMGLGPLMAIYQARFDKYLQNRGLMTHKDRTVWAFCGDGEMDEPESLGALGVASREGLGNLIFVVNCNLQRLDGPVRGNGKIIQELERIFLGNGWCVIKVIWNQAWMRVIENDPTGQLLSILGELVDGDYQAIAENPDLIEKKIFFTPQLKQYFNTLSSDLISSLQWGGHDYSLVHAAFKKAKTVKNQPVVILAKTVKGYRLGKGIQAANTTHQHKKIDEEGLINLAKQWQIPLTDTEAKVPGFYHPGDQDPAIKYMHQTRQNLGGYLPSRQFNSQSLAPLSGQVLAPLYAGSDRPMSTTMGFVRVLSLLLREQSIKDHLVPIVPDESRTFGMEGLFRQIGIYAPEGQKYEPVDQSLLMYYKESQSGQLLQEGINEAGAMASWIAAACAYANAGIPLIPFYIYYSMFGFQRVGDLAWAAADARARGFLIGATAGRTTLAGEGLQHNDGHSHVLSSVIPSCRSYDPAYIYELAVIVEKGYEDMMVNQQDLFYYITVMNENTAQPAMPEGVKEGIIAGMYLLQKTDGKLRVNLLGSGTILQEVIAAANWLSGHNIGADIFSVTSYTELARSHASMHRKAKLKGERFEGYVASLLGNQLTIAASDYMRQVPEQIRAYVPGYYDVLGTDGYGRSDTRIALREFHEVNWRHIAHSVVYGLFDTQMIKRDQFIEYQKKLGIDLNKPCPVNEGVTA